MLAIIILSMIPAIVSTVLHTYLCQKRNYTQLGIKQYRVYFQRIIGYEILYLVVLAVLKICMGDTKIALAESFTEVYPLTFVHYGVPLLAFAALIQLFVGVIDIFIKGILRCYDDYICMWGQVASFVFAVTYLFFDYMQINNISYCIIAIISALISAIIVCVKKRYCKTKDESEEKWIRVSYCIVVSFFMVMIFVFIPGEVYYGNVGEIAISEGLWTGGMYKSAIIWIVSLCILGTFVWNITYTRIFRAILSIAGISGYMQMLFGNGDMRQMDGVSQTYSSMSLIWNAIIWLIFSIIILALYYYEKKNVKHIVGYLTLCILFVQLFTHIAVRLTTTIESPVTYELNTDEMLTVSSKNNIIVFVLDSFDGQVMDRIVEEDTEFLFPLNDFTYYSNCTSMYTNTALGLPYLLTGISCDANIACEDYHKYAYDNDKLLNGMDDLGYNIQFFTGVENIDDVQVGGAISNFNIKKDEQRVDFRRLQSLDKKISYYLMMPLFMKKYYYYGDNDISQCKIEPEKKYDSGHDYFFYSAIKDEGVSVKDNYNKVYRMYHLYGAHAYPAMDDVMEPANGNITIVDAGKGTLRIVYRYLEELKKIDVYDNSTIIITADHGQNITIGDATVSDYFIEQGLQSTTSNPILFVKNRDEKHLRLIESAAPVSHTDIVSTIAHIAELEYADEYGVTLDEIAEDEERIRYLNLNKSDSGVWNAYEINGNVKDYSSWTSCTID